MAIGGLSFANDDSTCEKVITTITTAIGASVGDSLGSRYGLGVGAVAGIAAGKALSDKVCNNDDSDNHVTVYSTDYSDWK